MGSQDVITKKYMSDGQKFSDAFNFYLYGGKKVIRANSLEPVDTTELEIIFSNGKSEHMQRIRDLLRECIIMYDDKQVYILLGMENESKIHYALPVKIMLYDALNYAKQVSQTTQSHREHKDTKNSSEFLSGFTKDDKLKPVVTLAIYWGAEPWDAPRSLKEMFADVDESILPYVTDYKLNLILPTEITDFHKFSTEFGKAMKYIAVSKDEKAYQETTEDEYYGTISVDTARLLNECVGTRIRINQKEEMVNMCKAWDDHEAQGREMGKKIGKEIGAASSLLDIISNLQENMSCSLEQALSFIGKTMSDYEKAKQVLGQE